MHSRSLGQRIVSPLIVVYQMITFAVLLVIYLLSQALRWIGSWWFFPQSIVRLVSPVLLAIYNGLVALLDFRRSGTISRIDLIELAIRNMKVKKSRSVVTIGGMMIGIGAIVFLVSLGYGVQQLVISQVARLEEMRQTDVSTQAGAQIRITDKTLADFQDIPTVEGALPLIEVVGQVNYQNSATDVAVYGVQSDYLQQSAITPVVGELFDSNELVTATDSNLAEAEDSSSSQNDNPATNRDTSLNDTDQASPSATQTEDGWVVLETESSTTAPPEVTTVQLSAEAKQEAVINRAMVKVLGLDESQAVGETFRVSFVVVGELLANADERIESEVSEYTIVGVTPDDKTPMAYVPFIDLRTLGITNYSQVKVAVEEQSDLAAVRQQIEAMGYTTQSVADTVEQINSLFATARAVLAVVGMVALAIAALGMFNTLTVSLLERTREVGLMKAMGMKPSEVRELFITESMVMGFLGGILGIATGFVVGKLVSVLLSMYAVFEGVGFIDISAIPLAFAGVVLVLSFVVGLVTGLYPAKRATKISALNALRYE